MAYEAKIIADSISKAGDRLTTFQVTFPRIVLAEFNTHRALSKNSASSRAIPVEKQILKLEKDPFVPEYWGKNQKGMQAEEEINFGDTILAKRAWLDARDEAISAVKSLQQLGVHKQITNRLLEPFMWQTVVCTGTEYSNFFALRANSMAQPEIRVIAEMMKELYATSKPRKLYTNEWHLPYVSEDEQDEFLKYATEHDLYGSDIQKISAARCARVSYLTQEGKRDLQADLDLYERLAGSGHLSPLEHVATPHYVHLHNGYSSSMSGNFRGWKQLRKFIPHEEDFGKADDERRANSIESG